MRFFNIILALALPTASLSLAAQESKDTTIVIKGAVVSANRHPSRAGTGSISIPARMIKDTPALLGEADVLKTIQLLPGVQAGTEGLSGIYIRGGGSDENLILLDGMPVYGAGHLLGIFSPFQGEAVDDAVIHKGYFPAKFGGRASSVLEINTSTGNTDKTAGSLGIGVLSDKFHVEGPALKRKMTYSLSGRGMHTLLMDGLFKAFKVPANLYFHDLHAKATFPMDNPNRLSVSYFTSKDNLYYKEDEGKAVFSWGNDLGSVDWSRNWSPALRSDVKLGISRFSMDSGYEAPGQVRSGYKTGLNDIILKAGLVFEGFTGHYLRAGTDITHHLFIPESGEEGGGKTRIRGSELAVYLEDHSKPVGWLSAETGLRISAFSSGGVTRLYPEPRLTAKARITDRIDAQVSYSRTTQYIHQLSSSLAVLPVDLIVPVTKKTGPIVSDQVSLGLGARFRGGWKISVEGYLKAQKEILEYKDGILFIDDFDDWEDMVAQGVGRARGVELLVRKEDSKYSGWIGYTLSRSERKIPDGSVGSGEWFPCRFDCRHSITAVLNRKFGKGWDAGLTWTYSQGGAITVPLPDGSTPRRGNVRLPPSHRLDAGIKHRKPLRRGESIWNLGVYNAYNRKNPNLVFPVSGDGEDGSGPYRTISFLPIIPSVGYSRVF